jgi:hypothetical protein
VSDLGWEVAGPFGCLIYMCVFNKNGIQGYESTVQGQACHFLQQTAQDIVDGDSLGHVPFYTHAATTPLCSSHGTFEHDLGAACRSVFM